MGQQPMFLYDIIVIKYGREVQAVAVQFSRQLLLHKMQHTLDLTENLAMQDLVRTIAEEMKVSPEGAEPETKRIKNFMKAMDNKTFSIDDVIFEFLIFQAESLGFHI